MKKTIKLTETKLKRIIENILSEAEIDPRKVVSGEQKGFILGENGLESSDDIDSAKYVINDELYEKLKPLSKSLSERLKLIDEKRRLEIRHFDGVVQKFNGFVRKYSK